MILLGLDWNKNENNSRKKKLFSDIMNHQDWTTVVMQGKAKKKGITTSSAVLRTGNYEVKKKHNVDHAKFKLDNETETFEHKKVSHKLSVSIQQARAGKKWSRQELAQKLNVKASVITEYETGKAIPDNQILQKLSRVLGVTLKKSM